VITFKSTGSLLTTDSAGKTSSIWLSEKLILLESKGLLQPVQPDNTKSMIIGVPIGNIFDI
jgi:hypothetical protein